ncbi:protein adenylyltransferase SelO isoform X1 [Pocillopora verrucosa]|uniref:protein adenylyltransferase SelO isoform X1 n=1 Tax=Pocillopora verrucosa TaxID=203993 RepID=UPI00333F9384
MAENLGLFRCPLPIFIFFLFHGSVLSVVNGDLWKIHCISLKDHSVCETNMFLLLVQMVSVCRKTELLEFKNWSFMERSILLKEFDVDEETRNYIRQVHGVIFSKVHLVPLKYKPYLVAISQEVLTDILDLNDSAFESPAFIDFAAGNEMIPNSIMLSHRYGGHQFGDWAGQLGDGRAVILGEYTNRIGERWELQLKGSGRTPYSRHGDGRAVLRSSVREFLASEAMFHLGVPTSRAASLIVSNDLVWRDQFYDGHPKQEKVAIVLRLAKSWFRIGSLEILEHNSEEALLRKVVDFVIENNFQDLVNKTKKYLAFFSRVVSMTADLISKWQSVGFAHGVCNTDNFSLLSITIDYGPFGFMDDFNPDFVPNTSDDEGRYSYKNQPNVGFFNLEKLLQALKPLIEDYSEGEKVLWSYVDRFNQRFLSIFRRKLGLLYEDENDEMLIHSFLWIMSSTHADFTMAFRELSEVSLHDVNSNRLPRETWALKQLQTHKNWGDWLAHYVDRSRLYSDTDVDKARRKQMQEVNPRYVLRNWMAESAIQKAERNDFSEVRQLLEVLKSPFTKQEVAENLGYSSQPPGWASHLRVSCSS